MSDDLEHPGRPTTASIDRRVGRLEDAQAATDRKVDQLALQLGYVKDLMEMKLTTMQSAIDANASRFDALATKIEGMIADATKNAGDLRANPLGRQIDDRLKELEGTVEAHDKALNQYQGFGYGLRAYVLPVLAFALSIAALSLTAAP
jgi:hypothetical protein